MTQEEKDRRLLELRARIPESTCPAGCFACCSEGVRVSHTEMRRISPPVGINLTGCVWLGPNGRCRVYEERPIRCRLFGVAGSGDMHCPIGCKPETTLSDDEAMAIIRDYEETFADELHTYTALGQEYSTKYGRGKKEPEKDDGRIKRAGPWVESKGGEK